jgi:hypothetical protein
MDLLPDIALGAIEPDFLVAPANLHDFSKPIFSGTLLRRRHAPDVDRPTAPVDLPDFADAADRLLASARAAELRSSAGAPAAEASTEAVARMIAVTFLHMAWSLAPHI